jgi:hypothetical protein
MRMNATLGKPGFALGVAVGVLLSTACPAGAQETNKIGTAAATFLRIPVGARAAGMGGAFVSMMDDPAALYWNPSVLAPMTSRVLVADHTRWLPGIDFDFAGIVLPFGDAGTVGISASVLQTEEMEVTTPQQQMGTGETFTASSIALGVTYSRSLTDRFAIGGTFKYVRENIYNSSASAIAFDVGTIFETPFAGIRLGASITNFGTKMQMDGEDLNLRVDVAPGQEGNNQSVVGRLHTDAYDLPLTMRVGISGELFQTPDYRLTFAVDGVNPNDNAASVNCGGELGLLNEVIRLRAGYRDLFLDENEFSYTFGVSVHAVELMTGLSASLDYGYQKFVHLGDSNRFTLSLRF